MRSFVIRRCCKLSRSARVSKTALQHRAAWPWQFFPRRAPLWVIAANERTKDRGHVHSDIFLPFPLIDAVGDLEVRVEKEKTGDGVNRNLQLVEVLFEGAAVDPNQTDVIERTL